MLSPHFQLITAENGKDGLSLFFKALPDLIICDLMLPDMDAMQIVEKIRQTDPPYNTTPIMILTGIAEEEMAIEYLNKGVDDYLTKPAKIEYLRAKINNLLNQRRFVLANTVGSENDIVEDPLLTKVKSYVINNLESEILIADLSSYLNCSVSTLERKIKSITTFTPKRYISRIKIAEARKMIENNPSLNIMEIAYKTGFNSPSYFIRNYKLEYGISPHKDKKNLKK